MHVISRAQHQPPPAVAPPVSPLSVVEAIHQHLLYVAPFYVLVRSAKKPRLEVWPWVHPSNCPDCVQEALPVFASVCWRESCKLTRRRCRLVVCENEGMPAAEERYHGSLHALTIHGVLEPRQLCKGAAHLHDSDLTQASAEVIPAVEFTTHCCCNTAGLASVDAAPLLLVDWP